MGIGSTEASWHRRIARTAALGFSKDEYLEKDVPAGLEEKHLLSVGGRMVFLEREPSPTGE